MVILAYLRREKPQDMLANENTDNFFLPFFFSGRKQRGRSLIMIVVLGNGRPAQVEGLGEGDGL